MYDHDVDLMGMMIMEEGEIVGQHKFPFVYQRQEL